MSGALQQAQSRTTEACWIPGVVSLAKHQRMGEAGLFPWKPNCNEKETKRNLHRQHQVWLRESLKRDSPLTQGRQHSGVYTLTLVH